MKTTSIITLALIALTAGCGDSRIRELRGEFIEGCTASGAKKAVCACTFEQIQENYTNDQLLDMKIGVIPKDFREFTAQASLRCMRDN